MTWSTEKLPGLCIWYRSVILILYKAAFPKALRWLSERESPCSAPIMPDQQGILSKFRSGSMREFGRKALKSLDMQFDKMVPTVK